MLRAAREAVNEFTNSPLGRQLPPSPKTLRADGLLQATRFRGHRPSFPREHVLSEAGAGIRRLIEVDSRYRGACSRLVACRGRLRGSGGK